MALSPALTCWTAWLPVSAPSAVTASSSASSLQALGAVPGERVLLLYRTAKAHHVFGGVGPLGVLPARVGLPCFAELGRLLADCLHCGAFLGCASPGSWGTGKSGPKPRVYRQTINT